MELYHFCSRLDIESIKKEGLTKGMCPVLNFDSPQLDNIRIIQKCQWLTQNPNFDQQTWDTQTHLNYARTDYRLTIHIPKKHNRKLVTALSFVKTLPTSAQGFVTEYPGGEDWYIYLGKILPQWIKEVV